MLANLVPAPRAARVQHRVPARGAARAALARAPSPRIRGAYARRAHFVWQYFAVTNNTDARKGSTKNAVCMFCDKNFSGCSTSRADSVFLL